MKMRTKADLLNDPRVESLWKEDHPELFDKYVWWIQLAPGWIHDANQTTCLHEPTIAILIDEMFEVVKMTDKGGAA